MSKDNKAELAGLLREIAAVLSGPLELKDPEAFYEENREKLKEIIDKSPRKFLDQHEADAVKNNWFELAAHIRDRKRLLDLNIVK